MARVSVGSRPATSRRKSFAQKHNKPGSALATLWYAYSGHNDEDVLLETQLEWANFLWVEATPNVHSADYAPLRSGKPANKGFRVVSTAILNDGSAEWHVISSGEDGVAHGSSFGPRLPVDVPPADLMNAAQAAGAALVVRSWADFQVNSILLSNWSRALSWIAAARYHGLSEFQNDVLLELRNAGTLSLGDALRCRTDSRLKPLIVAGIFRLVQQGRVSSDLDLNPLSMSTVIMDARNEIESRPIRKI